MSSLVSRRRGIHERQWDLFITTCSRHIDGSRHLPHIGIFGGKLDRKPLESLEEASGLSFPTDRSVHDEMLHLILVVMVAMGSRIKNEGLVI